MIARIVEKRIPRMTAPRHLRVNMMMVTTRPKMVTSTGTPLSLGTFVGVPVLVTIFGLVVTIIMFTRKWRGAVILGILFSTILAIILNYAYDKTSFMEGTAVIPSKIFAAPDFSLVGAFDFGAFAKLGVTAAILWIFSLMLSDFFDTMGTIVGVGGQACYLDDKGDLPQVNRPLLVASLAADADDRAHGVEEVAQHEAEDPQDGGGDAELGEGAEIEGAHQAEVGRREDLARDDGGALHERGLVVGVVEDDRKDRGEEDPEDDGPAPLAREHDDGDHEAEDGDQHRHADEGPERQRRAAAAHDEAAVDKADEQDEEADADDDGLLQLERDGLEDGLAEAGEHEDRDGHALEEDEAHGALEAEPLTQHQAEGDDCVEAHAGGDGVGAVGEEAHDDRHHAGHEAGRGECGRERQALPLQTEDARVHEDDVGHDDERREPGQGVALERRVPLLELEEALQRVVRVGVSGGFHSPRPPSEWGCGARMGRVYRTRASRRYGNVTS